MTTLSSDIVAIISKASSKDLDECLEGLSALQKLDTKTLIEVLEVSASRVVQTSIMFILVGRGDLEAVEPIVKLLDSSDYTIRWRAVEQLGGLRDKRAVEPILKLLRRSYVEKEWLRYTDDLAHLRSTIFSALAQLGDERAIPDLEWVAKHDDLFHSRQGYGMAENAAYTIKRIRKEV